MRAQHRPRAHEPGSHARGSIANGFGILHVGMPTLVTGVDGIIALQQIKSADAKVT
jgi:hypothetical protein